MSIETVKSALRQDRQCYVLMELDLNGRMVRVTNRPGGVSFDDYPFDGVLERFSPIGTSFDPRTFVSASTAVSIKLANGARYQDGELVTRIEGGRGRAWLWSESLDRDDIEDYPVWAGSIRGDSFDGARYGLSIMDHSFDRGRQMDDLNISGLLADQVAYLWSARTTLDATDLHNVSLATLRALRGGLAGTVTVDKTANAFDVSDRILGAMKAGRIQIWGAQGVTPFDLAGPVTTVLKDEDFLTDWGEFGRTPRDMLCNDLKIRYEYNSSDFDHETVLDRFNSALCAESFAAYGELPQREIWVGDATTEVVALAAGALHLDWFALGKATLRDRVRAADGIDLFEGAKAHMTRAAGPSADGAGWADEECILLQRQFTGSYWEQVWMAVNA